MSDWDELPEPETTKIPGESKWISRFLGIAIGINFVAATALAWMILVLAR